METLKHFGIGFSTPRLLPFRHHRKPQKLPPTICFASKWAERLLADFQFLGDSSSSSSDHHSLSSATATLAPPHLPPAVSPPERHVSIPIDFYQVLGAQQHFLGDGIRRAYEARASKPPQYGFTQEALFSRRQILLAACETLADPASRREYNQSLAEDEDGTIITQVPWDKVPGALCVLQEAGKTELVLQIGESLLRERLPKSFKQDVVLVMALAYVDMSRDAMELSPPDFIRGCEVLERALKLLQEEGASSLAPDLQLQIDETLEEITPRCILELLALPLRDEDRSRREEGLHGVRNILWSVGGGGAVAIAGGFTRENFMNEAFLHMTATEQVDLFVATPSNIPAESFEVYGVALALVAQAFVGKKPHHIQDADNLFQKLQQSKVTAVGHSVETYSEVDMAGRARAVVVGVGTHTAMGGIHDSMLQTEDEVTPLKKKLDEFGTFLAKVIAGICVLVWIVNIGHFRDPAHGGFLRGAIHYFKIAVALAVAAIPEGLPAVVTTCLALGTKRMARLNAIVRSLPSVETLGCTTVICSDKTGTLTTNMMSASKVCVLHTVQHAPVISEYSVSGTTYAPEGLIFDSTGLQLELPAQSPCLLHIAMCSALCNESILQYNPDKSNYEKIGESTEVALRVLAEKIGLPGFDSMPSSLNMLSKHERASYCNRYWEDHFKKISVADFSRDRKMMSVLCSRNQLQIMFSKGAPESIISRCTSILCNDDGSAIPLTTSIRAELESRFHSFAGKETLRCLALAFKRMPMGLQSLSHNDEKDLTFIGLIGMLDPPREEVRNAMLSCMTAGIRVIVVTGDNKSTAESLCRKIGAFDHLEDLAGHSYTATEFEELPAMQKTLALQRMALFTRVEPSHKRMLVEALRNQNEVVAMTGDGVNDAPALKKADIGIAMGSGTAVAKSASDMVLADDNFATIVAAVAEGRAIYNNTKQFIRYMISSNIGEVVCIFVAAVLGIPDTLAPVQLLWVNLVTDGLPATAIGFNKQDSDVMKAKPRKVNEAVVSGWLFFRYLVIGAYVGLATVAGFIWWFVYSDSGPQLPYSELMNFDSCSTRETTYPCSIFDDRHPSTVSMTVLVVVEMFNALNNLSENQSLVVIPPWSNLWLVGSIILTMILHVLILYVHPLSILFSVTPLSWADWIVVLYLSFPVVIIDEVLKFFSRSSTGTRWFNLRWRRPDFLPKRESRDK